MTKTFKTQIGAVLTALCLTGASLPAAAAQENLPTRAINALGMAIAAQGDAALVTIRQELKEVVADHIKPYLPEPDASTDRKSAEADAPRQ
jgi:hypothetical protein